MAQYRKRQFGNKTSSFILTMMMLSMAFTVISLPSAGAADGDGDGIDDALDDCEFASGNSTVDYIGCPDDDGDGVPNFIGQQLGDWGATQRELYHSGGDSRAVAWSPDGRYIAGAGSSGGGGWGGGGGNGTVNLYWVGGHISTLVSISQNVRALEFSPNGSYLAVGGYEEDGWTVPRGWMLVLEMDWATQSATILQNLSHLHFGDVPSVSWSSDGLFLYTGGENEIRKFSVNDNWTMMMNYSYANGNVHWRMSNSSS
jgi:WD40 repeat protein